MTYIHGTDPEEQGRLLRLNALLNERCLTKIRLNPDFKVLDVGSGLGVFSRDLARNAQGVTVLGVEPSGEQLQKAARLAREQGEEELVEFRQGQAQDLPLKKGEWQSFDLVFMRFVLEHLQDPQGAVIEASKALRPGGKMILVDDDHANFRLHPEVFSFGAIWENYCKVYDRAGQDPYVGRRLISFLHHAGFSNLKMDFIRFGATASETDFIHYANNLIEILQQTAGNIVNPPGYTITEFTAAIADIKSWSQLPDATLWYFANWAEGIKK